MVCCAAQVPNQQVAEPKQAEAMGAGGGGGGGGTAAGPPGDGIDQDLQARLDNLRKQ